MYVAPAFFILRLQPTGAAVIRADASGLVMEAIAIAINTKSAS